MKLPSVQVPGTFRDELKIIIRVAGIVLAKLDGSARGGVIVPVAERFELPVKFVGLGESADDLATFDPESFVDAMLEGVLRP